jgi:hypothetical protein
MNIFEKIKREKSRDLSEMINLNNEFAFYSKSCKLDYSEPFYGEFKRLLNSIYMDRVKANRFVEIYMQKRVPTAKLINKIFSKLSIVWTAQNQTLAVELQNNSLNSEAEAYLMPFIEFIRSKWIHESKESLCGFVVVELEKNELTNSVAPKIEFLEASDVVYFEDTENDLIKEIVYKTDVQNEYAYINEFSYQLIDIEKELILVDIPHNLSITPAAYFAPAKHTFENLFSDFFEYTRAKVELFKKQISDINVDKVIPKDSCGSENIETTQGYKGKCIGGKLYYNFNDMQDQPVISQDGEHEYCPVCGIKTHIGAGTVYVYDTNSLKETGLSTNSLVAYVDAPTETTKLLQEFVQNYETNIIATATGTVKDNVTLQRNEIDIKSDFEDSTKILEQFGNTFAIPINIIVRVLLEMKYTKDAIISSIFYFGNKWFLLEKAALIKEKNEATNGIERFEAIKKILDYDYQHDKEKSKLMQKMYELYPYASITDVQFFELIDKNLVSVEDAELRTNFIYYIQEIQREITKNPIKEITYDILKEKINTILKKNLETRNNTIKIEENGKNGTV